MSDWKLEVREIVEAIGISPILLVSILSNYLLSERWVARLLTVDQKRNPMTTSKECWALYNRNLDEFIRHLITVYEGEIYLETLETKE